ncbi:MAG: hypothetical protein NVS2B8_03340 [Vulcanimicrobiaceae bacterium]
MTIDRLALYARTASYLRREQIADVVYRRFVPRSRPHAAFDTARVRRREPMTAPLRSNISFGGVASVDALTTEGDGAPYIDWQCSTKSRLWRYHLHYFDFLNEPDRSVAWKRTVIANWIDAHATVTGDAWDAYPVSLRIVNWVKFLDTALEAGERQMLASLYAQTLWLETNLERRVRANHLFKNAKALIFAGLFFAGTDAERWLGTGMRLFLDEINEQFLADGGHYERSPMYHLLAVEDLLDVRNIVRSSRLPALGRPNETVRDAAMRGLDFLHGLLLPDETIPLFNDAAWGVGPQPLDLFAYGKAMVDYRRPPRPQTLAIAAFGSSGYYVIRNASDALVIDCGDPGPTYQPGHAHADCLSYELALDGRRVVVDTGVHDYEPTAARSYARSTAAHNTVTIDGRSQCELWGTFRMARRARPIDPHLATSDGEARFAGGCVGFYDRSSAVRHDRAVRHRGRFWCFEDRISGTGVRLVENRIHLAPDLEARRLAQDVVIFDRSGRRVARIAPPQTSSIRLERAPYFPRFGESHTIDVVVFASIGPLPMTSSYTIERL